MVPHEMFSLGTSLLFHKNPHVMDPHAPRNGALKVNGKFDPAQRERKKKHLVTVKALIKIPIAPSVNRPLRRDCSLAGKCVTL